ncbi:hypothetical protein CYMTET_31307 [Cymbomonas tetramitiformis]|uniref:Uncharacterized protein n=1 Tax=Cymbomonas tetramitiformis TaxID=36881 RepID=A0AAE0FHQ1_9CHLO|nr:hypothetical protein CYMTET_31307 [Cymbomonas tetramitiformis]
MGGMCGSAARWRAAEERKFLPWEACADMLQGGGLLRKEVSAMGGMCGDAAGGGAREEVSAMGSMCGSAAKVVGSLRRGSFCHGRHVQTCCRWRAAEERKFLPWEGMCGSAARWRAAEERKFLPWEACAEALQEPPRDSEPPPDLCPRRLLHFLISPAAGGTCTRQAVFFTPSRLLHAKPSSSRQAVFFTPSLFTQN